MCCTSGRFKMKALPFWCEEKERKGECEENIKGTCTGRERKRRGRREGERRRRGREKKEREKRRKRGRVLTSQRQTVHHPLL